jgi:hypothetical protein
VRIALLIAAVSVIAVSATTAHAFRPQYCARIYDTSRSELSGHDWKQTLLAWPNRSEAIESMTKSSWVSCRCLPAQTLCSCCDFNVEKVCAESSHVNMTTNDRTQLGACEGN